ncbi:hypothetical protein GWC77_04725 [Paraburkholderia sp. NMBU_R16]|uniref:hypothetical protein n=1 Tax=Paraburkholderia sp. NMBU_R16 TaxID=2698676 RepID=UPI00156480CC|nr:hypothetical protein [Paraburkholderia sp. NMBU_R16]NRO95241.1 hypothetical protein [Paraburkholderia sp. NMBU_R16]
MSAATLTRPETALWSTYPQPFVPRAGNTSAKAASPSLADYYSVVNGGESAQAQPDDINALFEYIMQEAALHTMVELAATGGDSAQDQDPEDALAALLAAQSWGGGGGSTGGDAGGGFSGSGPSGDSNVGTISGGNPAGIAERLVGQPAASLQANQLVPMHRGVPTDVCCANFVSACLQKAGLLSSSEHTDSAPQLKTTLQHKGWHTVSRSQAKPGDVCFVIGSNGVPEHVELVAKNAGGRITLVGSNNTNHGSGPQVVSNDTWTGNQGNVVFLSPP